MSSRKVREVLATAVITMFTGQGSLYPIMYPYIVSYLKYKSDSFSFKMCYLSFFFDYFSYSLWNKIQPYFYRYLGIKNTFNLGGLLSLIWLFLYLKTPNIYCFYLQAMLLGLVSTINIQTPLVFLRTAYKENGLKYYGYIMSSPLVWLLVFALFSPKIVNPTNRGMDFMIDGEKYYSRTVCDNLWKLFCVHGFATSVLVWVSVLFLRNPEGYEGEWTLFVTKSLRKLRMRFFKTENN